MNSGRHLIVHVPGLQALCREAGKVPAELERIRARGREIQLTGDCPPAGLLNRPGIPAAGPLTRLALESEQNEAGGCWIRADPVSLVPDLTAVWVQGPARLPAGGARDRLVREFKALFQAEGIELVAQEDGFGLVRIDQVPDCQFSPPWQLYGARLDQVLPAGPESGRWHRLINESQMILHQFGPQAAHGQPGLGLWFWGAGELTASPNDPGGVEIDPGDEPIFKGLARWLGASQVHTENIAPPAGTRLVHWPVRTDQAADVQLKAINDNLLQPAWHAVRRGKLHRLTVAGNARAWQVSLTGAWKFWRRVMPPPE